MEKGWVMSTSPYSLDLREKVIAFLQSGKTQKEAAHVFALNKMTVNGWYLRYKKEGHCRPKARPGAKPRLSLEALIKYLEIQKDARLIDIAHAFGLSQSGAHYWTKKLGFTYKKKPSPTWRPRSKNEKNLLK